MAGGSLALVSSIVQSPLGGFELRLFFRFLFTGAAHKGPGYLSWSFFLGGWAHKPQAGAGGPIVRKQ